MINKNLFLTDAFLSAEKRLGNAPISSDGPFLSCTRKNDDDRNGVRKHLLYRPVAVEVCGAMSDPCVKEIVSLLRKYCARYSMLLRMITTLVAMPLPERDIFGDFSIGEETRKPPVCTTPPWAVTANFSVPVIERFHCQTKEKTKSSEKYRISSGSLDSLDFFSDDLESSKQIFCDFMAYHFFPLLFTQNFSDENDEGFAKNWNSYESKTLIVRHYVHETTRTGSFLVADLNSKKAALIDPLLNIEEYEEDLRKFSLQLDFVFVTHCFVDVLSGVDRLRAKYTDLKVLSGISLESAGTIHHVKLSDRISFLTVSMPSFSPENIVIEMYVLNDLVAVFSGTAWSTDCAPRADFFAEFPLYFCSEETELDYSTEDRKCLSIQIAFNSLSRHFRDRYFSKSLTPLFSSIHRDKVVLFPSHGGYNNVTGQLDLYWGCFLGDLFRAKHSRVVLDSLASIESYTTAVLSSQSLPSPLLFRATRWANFTSLWNLVSQDQQLLITKRHRESFASFFFSQKSNIDQKRLVPVPFHYPKTPVLFLDCRDYAEYHQLHVKGSISVPMSFPSSAFNALKAELWLECLLLPGQAVVVQCCLEKKEEVKRRIALLSPDAFIQVFTLNELIGEDDLQKKTSLASTNAPHSTNGNKTSDIFRPQTNDSSYFHLFSAPCAVRLTGTGLPETLEWVHNSEPYYRLDSHEKLEAVNPRKTAVVVDVRTPSEFKNGSHQFSIPFTLSALCELSAQDHLASNSSPSPSLSATLMKSLKSKFYHAAKNDFNIAKIVPLATAKDPVGWKDVIFYCAAGYRSLIAISLFRRAFETSYKCSSGVSGRVFSTSNNLYNPSEPWTKVLESIKLVDIPGGALQLMTQRPDLWQVKDRSIICIS